MVCDVHLRQSPGKWLYTPARVSNQQAIADTGLIDFSADCLAKAHQYVENSQVGLGNVMICVGLGNVIIRVGLGNVMIRVTKCRELSDGWYA
jgi:hypothetical protein